MKKLKISMLCCSFLWSVTMAHAEPAIIMTPVITPVTTSIKTPENTNSITEPKIATTKKEPVVIENGKTKTIIMPLNDPEDFPMGFTRPHVHMPTIPVAPIVQTQKDTSKNIPAVQNDALSTQKELEKAELLPGSYDPKDPFSDIESLLKNKSVNIPLPADYQANKDNTVKQEEESLPFPSRRKNVVNVYSVDNTSFFPSKRKGQ